MRAKEGTYLAHGQRNPLRRLFPRKDADFRLRRKHCSFHSDGVGMGRDIIRQGQYRRLTVTDEITGYCEDEVRVGAVHFRQKFVDHLHRDLWPAFDELWAPAGHVVVIEESRHFGAKTARLSQNGSDNAIGCGMRR